MSDLDLIDAVRSAGLTPTDASRAAMRDALESAIRGHEAPTVVRLDVVRSRRMAGRWMAGGLVAAAAAVATVVVVTGDDGGRSVVPATDPTTESVDSAPNTTSATTDPAAPVTTGAGGVIAPVTLPTTESAAPTGSVTYDELTGHRWVVTGQDGEPLAAAVMPFVDFGADGAITGSDGCNRFSAGSTISDGLLRLTSPVATEVSCGDRPVAMAADGDRPELTADGTSLTLTGPDRTLELVALDGLAPISNPADIDGLWTTGAEDAATIDFATLYSNLFIGDCIVGFSLEASALTVTDPASPNPCTSAPGLNADDTELRGLLRTADPIAVANSGNLLFLSRDVSVIRLSPVRIDSAPAAMDLRFGAVAGVQVGQAITAEDVLATVEPDLGPVDHDTGWYTTPVVTYEDGTQDCLGGTDFRVLWWGDLSIALWGRDGVESIWAWSVGDRRATGWGDRREPYTPVDPIAAGLVVSDGGLRIGSTVDELTALYGARFSVSATTNEPDGMRLAFSAQDGSWDYVVHRGGGVTLSILDDAVTGISAARQFC